MRVGRTLNLRVQPGFSCFHARMAVTNEFSWSKTRDEMFRDCLRKYYFHYYGAWGGWDPHADERTRQLYILKNLQTRAMWAGDRVHRAIHAALAAEDKRLELVPGAHYFEDSDANLARVVDLMAGWLRERI